MVSLVNFQTKDTLKNFVLGKHIAHDPVILNQQVIQQTHRKLIRDGVENEDQAINLRVKERKVLLSHWQTKII